MMILLIIDADIDTPIFFLEKKRNTMKVMYIHSLNKKKMFRTSSLVSVTRHI